MAYNNGITVVAEEIQFWTPPGCGEGIVALKGMETREWAARPPPPFTAQRKSTKQTSRRFLFREKSQSLRRQGSTKLSPDFPLLQQPEQGQRVRPQRQPRFPHRSCRVAGREWTPDQKTKWFYERARGSYQTAKNREGTTEAKRRDFETKYPPHQRFTKEDLAKFENAWRSQPHIVAAAAKKLHPFYDFGKQR